MNVNGLNMKLTVFSRKESKRSQLNEIRRNGNVPAVIYGQGRDNENITIQGDDLRAVLRNMKSGLLATTVFELHDGKKTHRAIVKDIQYHPVSYAVLHVDFAVLKDDMPVTVNVPINVVGQGECAGIKLGGFLRQVLRTLRVTCLPKHIPAEFVLDITKLDVTQSLKLSDISIPASVRPLGKMNQVAVVIAKKAG